MRKIFLILFSMFVFVGCVHNSIQDTVDDTVEEIVVPQENVLVTKVIDGDTIIIQGGQSVRLLGIDTAERREPCFEVARERMKELVLNKQVQLEKDVEDTDKYDRLLRYIFVGDEHINEIMVQEGLAIAGFSFENKKYSEILAQAEADAIKAKRGCLWKDVDN